MTGLRGGTLAEIEEKSKWAGVMSRSIGPVDNKEKKSCEDGTGAPDRADANPYCLQLRFAALSM